ncbi:hypothetical protein E1262_07425 [Jiangella aurantiaca]|uniref:Phosphatase PAP2 family protein n=1 Tax=Jiangella aurantiaca TaxID=2530373 RepID=A0A4R5AH14_9ACTN|nr:hypothetical protein [Jiangella aurantiaca]TDD70955.1 hypothetical protein E1262_07425 [Jiangella aurantiaca]
MTGRTTRRGLTLLAAAASLGAAVAIAYVLGSTSWGTGVEGSVADLVSGWRDGVWRLLRGGFGRIVPPFVLVLLVVLIVAVHRRDPRTALFAAITAVGSNVTVQALKSGWLPFPPSARPSGEALLSGHVPLVLSGALMAVLVAPSGARRWVAALAALAVVATLAEVVVSGWHTVGEALAPALVFLAWVLLADAVTGGAGRRQP